MAASVYRCQFYVNQHLPEREFEDLEANASQIFLDFLENKDFGEGIRVFRFDLYVEPKINFGRQNDAVYTGCSHLSAHLDKQTFDNSDKSQKIKLLLSGSLLLLRYLAEKVPHPKGFHADRLVKDFEGYLQDQSLIIEPLEPASAVIKHFETTRFIFVRTTTIEVDENLIHFDLNEIEDFINNGLAGKTFGSITKVHFGFELYDFNGQFASFHKQTEGLMRFGPKYKNFLVVKHFDYSKVKSLSRQMQYELLKSKILEGINDFDQLARKPKDFEKDRFYETLEHLLATYVERK